VKFRAPISSCSGSSRLDELETENLFFKGLEGSEVQNVWVGNDVEKIPLLERRWGLCGDFGSKTWLI
jgi:hypothetical protein